MLMDHLNVKQDRIFPIFESQQVACQYIMSVTGVSQTRNWQGKCGLREYSS